MRALHRWWGLFEPVRTGCLAPNAEEQGQFDRLNGEIVPASPGRGWVGGWPLRAIDGATPMPYPEVRSRMSTATLTSKGQITIPKPIRDALGVEAGDRLEFLVRADGVVELFARTRDLMSLAGLIGAPSATRSADLDDVIAGAIWDEFERSVR